MNPPTTLLKPPRRILRHIAFQELYLKASTVPYSNPVNMQPTKSPPGTRTGSTHSDRNNFEPPLTPPAPTPPIVSNPKLLWTEQAHPNPPLFVRIISHDPNSLLIKYMCQLTNNVTRPDVTYNAYPAPSHRLSANSPNEVPRELPYTSTSTFT